MSNKDDKIIKELKVIKKLLAASLYVQGVDSEDIGKITEMGASSIRKLVSRKKKKNG